MNKIISLISMEVTLVSIFNNSVGPDGYMRLLMNSFPNIFRPYTGSVSHA